MKDILHAIIVFMIITSPAWIIWYIDFQHNKDMKERKCTKTNYFYEDFSSLKPVYRCDNETK